MHLRERTLGLPGVRGVGGKHQGAHEEKDEPSKRRAVLRGWGRSRWSLGRFPHCSCLGLSPRSLWAGRCPRKQLCIGVALSPYHSPPSLQSSPFLRQHLGLCVSKGLRGFRLPQSGSMRQFLEQSLRKASQAPPSPQLCPLGSKHPNIARDFPTPGNGGPAAHHILRFLGPEARALPMG